MLIPWLPYIFIAFIIGSVVYIVHYALLLYGINPFERLKPLTLREEGFISYNLPFYKKLSIRQRAKFKLRVLRFRKNKEIIFNGKVEREHEIVLLLSATAAMLSFGLKDHLFASVERIIVYPTHYYSIFTKKNHFGEYNPKLKTLVFSAEQLREGFKIPNDNVNLGAHEFAHALIFNMMRRRSYRARTFMVGMLKIKRLLRNPEFAKKVNESNYFRSYARTNLQEFFAVAVENYVETPEDFKIEFPELYTVVKKMLNVDYLKAWTTN